MSSHRNTEAIHGELGKGLAWSLLGEERKRGKSEGIEDRPWKTTVGIQAPDLKTRALFTQRDWRTRFNLLKACSTGQRKRK